MTRTNLNTGDVTVSGAYPLNSGYVQVTSTTRRKKPVDLFALGTARVVEDHHIKYDSVFLVQAGVAYDGPLSYFSAVDSYGLHPTVDINLRQLDGRLRSKIRDSNLNLAQSLAEYRQTSKMFVDLTNDVLRTFRSLRSGRALGDFVRSLKAPRSSKETAVANRWLQYQYGIRPLMSDLYGATDALVSKLRTGMYLYQRTHRKGGFSRPSVLLGDTNWGIKRYVTQRFEVRAKARYKIADPTLKQLSQLGITNPLLLVWELIPYSFVFDWIIPVGDFLESLDSLNGVSELRVLSGSWYEAIEEMSLAGSRGISTFTRSDRAAPRSDLDLPKLRYKPSESKLAIANGVALLRQLRR